MARSEASATDGKVRTVGTYQIFHDGVAQTGTGMKGMVAETRGPGANAPAGNNRRIEEGQYPISTQDGAKYVTIGYKLSESATAKPKPGIELNSTGKRSEILIHPGQGFLASVGCINPCTSLPNAGVTIDFAPSQWLNVRVTATLEQTQSELLRLIELAQRGEEVVITRQGHAIAKLTGVPQPRPSANRQVWLAKLARLRESTATGKTTPTTEQILEDLRGERG